VKDVTFSDNCVILKLQYGFTFRAIIIVIENCKMKPSTTSELLFIIGMISGTLGIKLNYRRSSVLNQVSDYSYINNSKYRFYN
jgi:hypothetical protein